MNLPDHIHPTAVDDALLNIGMTINEIRALTGDPAPQIIRTAEELEAIDPDAMLVRGAHDWEDPQITMSAQEWLADWGIDHSAIFPLAVIATGEQVRAARKALEEA